MRRSIRIVIVLLFIASMYLLLPFGFGVMAQRYSTQFLNNENNTLGKVLGIRLSFVEYKRGWFHSNAILEIDRKNSVGDWVLLQKMPIVIEHGPTFNAADRKVIGFGMVSIKDVPLFENSPYKLNLREVIRFNGERATMVLVDTQDGKQVNNFQVKSLMMTVKSNLKADNFVFTVVGKGLHFGDPAHSVSVDVSDLGLTLGAQYLDERHWKMTAGVLLKNDAISILLGNASGAVLGIHADTLNLERLHFDTQQMAKLLAELVKIKQASDAQQAVPPSSWMALFQQLLVQVIQEDTAVIVQGLEVKSPMGQVHLHYNISFPTLPQSHDYFDIATHGVGQFNVTIPHWSYVLAAQNKQFSLSDFKYSENNNTVFSRESGLSFGAFDVADTTVKSQSPLFYITGFDYHGDLHGTTDNLSQLMDWRFSKLCWSGQCFHAVSGGLKFMHMNFAAFRGIAAATQKIVQYDPNQPGSVDTRWVDLGNAYVQLISPKTEVAVMHQMQTPNGLVEVKGKVAWPGLVAGANGAVSLPSVLDQSVYQLHLQFPADYVDGFLSQMADASKSTVPATSVKPAEPSFDSQVADFLRYAISQGYLKKAGSAYQSDWSGKGASLSINGVAWKAQN